MPRGSSLLKLYKIYSEILAVIFYQIFQKFIKQSANIWSRLFFQRGPSDDERLIYKTTINKLLIKNTRSGNVLQNVFQKALIA